MMKRRALRLKLTAVIAGMMCLSVVPAITGASGSGAAAVSPHWVASWAASPSDDLFTGDSTLAPLPTSLTYQTVRDVVTPHLGGSQLRIHLSNRFDSSPTTFGHVTVGIQSSGAGATGIKNVTFGGSLSVTAAAGADVVSDPVNLTFAAFTPIAVSIYIPTFDQGSITKHWASDATTYYSNTLSGDVSTSTSASNYPNSFYSWFYVDGLDVVAPTSTCSVVAFGDSITDGWVAGSTLSIPESTIPMNVNGRYPDDLQRRLNSAGIPISMANAGIGSNELLGSLLGFTGPSGVSRFPMDALAQAGVCGVILQEGINDLGYGGATPATMETGYTQLINEAHAAGVKIWLGTLLPASNATVDGTDMTADSETYREQINSWILTQKLSNGVIDFASVLADPTNPTILNPAYASVDNLHPNLAGYQVMANTVPLSLLQTALPG